MIKFDIDKFSVKYVNLKSVTTALGGSITVVDEKLSKAKKKEVFKKISVPLAVARELMKRFPIRQYLQPRRTALAVYDGRVVAMDCRPIDKKLTPEQAALPPEMWKSNMETHIRSFLRPLVANGHHWYIDGTYVYSMPLWDTFAQSKQVSKDGRFNEIRVSAVKLADLHSDTNHKSVSERVCLMYEAANGDRMISPPVWSTLQIIGTTQFNRAGASLAETDIETLGAGMEAADDDHFDRVDEYCCVNLAFVLKAAKELVDIFGFDAIEPFNLPALMLQLKTVNLPNISKHVKQTYDSGIPFTHVCAWLLGSLKKVETLEAYLTVRSLIKYLTTKGVYRKNAFDTSSVFRAGHSVNTIPLKTMEEAAGYTGGFRDLTDYTLVKAAVDQRELPQTFNRMELTSPVNA